VTLGNDNGTDGQTDRRTDRVRRNMRPPPREEGRIKTCTRMINVAIKWMSDNSKIYIFALGLDVD